MIIPQIILGIFAPFLVFMAIHKKGLLPLFSPLESISISEPVRISEPVSISEPVPISEPIPPSDIFPVQNLTTPDETESGSSWAFQPRNFWKIFPFLIPGLISIPLCLMGCYLRRGGYREDMTKEELSHLKTWLQESESFMQAFRSKGAYMKGMKDNVVAEFQKQTDLFKKMIKDEHGCRAQLKSEIYSVIAKIEKEGKSCDEFKNEIGPMKNIMDEKEDERLAQFKNKIDSIWEMVEEEHKHHAELQNEIGSLLKMLEEESKHRAQLQSDIVQIKEMMEGDYEHRDQLKNEMASVKKMMEEEGERRAHFVNEIVGVRDDRGWRD
jgi:hypothetical protein